MPAPIMPAPSMPSLRTCDFGTPAGRRDQLVGGALVDEHRAHHVPGDRAAQQLREVLATRSRVPCRSAAACLRRRRTGSRSAPGSCAWSSLRDSAVPTMKVCGAAGFIMPAPPGTRKPFLSQGCTGSAPLSSQRSGGAQRAPPPARARCTMPSFGAPAGSSCVPSQISNGSAGSMPISRGSRCVPPAPGSKPDLHFRQSDARPSGRRPARDSDRRARARGRRRARCR